MVEFALAAAVALLVAGVVASFLPVVPGGLLSLAGVYGYWWATGFGPPGAAFVAAATVVGLAAVAVDYLAGAIAAQAGGASPATTVAAVAVGLVLLFVAGPVGTLLGIALTVLAVEVYRGATLQEGARVAAVTVVGVLASHLVQALLTGAILVGFLLAVLA